MLHATTISTCTQTYTLQATAEQEQTDCSVQGMAPTCLLVISPLDQIHMYKYNVTPRPAPCRGHGLAYSALPKNKQMSVKFSQEKKLLFDPA